MLLPKFKSFILDFLNLAERLDTGHVQRFGQVHCRAECLQVKSQTRRRFGDESSRALAAQYEQTVRLHQRRTSQALL